jgi:hypothetical protein
VSEQVSNLPVVERFVQGFLDPASGLDGDTLERLREETGDVVDAARSHPLEPMFELLAIEELVNGSTRSGVVEVLEACSADAWAIASVQSIGPLEEEDDARSAAHQLQQIDEQAATEVGHAACHHAAQACEALAEALAAALEEVDTTDASDQRHAAAHNAGRVFGELVVAGVTEDAVAAVRETGREALSKQP